MSAREFTARSFFFFREKTRAGISALLFTSFVRMYSEGLTHGFLMAENAVLRGEK